MRKGRKISIEQREKISAKLKGKIFSEETKNKISAAKIGHIVTDETKKKLRNANLGKKATDETKLKISASCKIKKTVKCIELEKIFDSISAVAKFFKITSNTIRRYNF